MTESRTPTVGDPDPRSKEVVPVSTKSSGHTRGVPTRLPSRPEEEIQRKNRPSDRGKGPSVPLHPKPVPFTRPCRETVAGTPENFLFKGPFLLRSPEPVLRVISEGPNETRLFTVVFGGSADARSSRTSAPKGSTSQSSYVVGSVSPQTNLRERLGSSPPGRLLSGDEPKRGSKCTCVRTEEILTYHGVPYGLPEQGLTTVRSLSRLPGTDSPLVTHKSDGGSSPSSVRDRRGWGDGGGRSSRP